MPTGTQKVLLGLCGIQTEVMKVGRRFGEALSRRGWGWGVGSGDDLNTLHSWVKQRNRPRNKPN